MKNGTVKPNLDVFLKPTTLIDSDHPHIVQQAEALTKNATSPEDKAREIFYFIRDHIRYLFTASAQEEKYRASAILKRGGGFCTQKAILFCALARCCGIPAGIYFFDILDHSLSTSLVKFMGTRIFYRHGVATLYLNGKWIKYDATLDIHLLDRNGLIPVEFSPQQDCLMHDKTKSGGKHIEYIKDYGLYADVSFEEMVSWFMKYYPHLIPKEKLKRAK